MKGDLYSTEEMILRDRLALDRTRLANERTLLSYIRTAFMLILAGATALKLFAGTPSIVITAWAFIVLGGFVLLLGTWRFLCMKQAIDRCDRVQELETER